LNNFCIEEVHNQFKAYVGLTKGGEGNDSLGIKIFGLSNKFLYKNGLVLKLGAHPTIKKKQFGLEVKQINTLIPNGRHDSQRALYHQGVFYKIVTICSIFYSQSNSSNLIPPFLYLIVRILRSLFSHPHCLIANPLHVTHLLILYSLKWLVSYNIFDVPIPNMESQIVIFESFFPIQCFFIYKVCKSPNFCLNSCKTRI